MKNFIKVLFLCVVVTVSSSVFTGCKKEGPVADPSAFLQQSIYNLLEVSSLRYVAELSTDGSGANVGGSVSADFVVSGAFSHTSEKKSSFEMTTVANAKDNDGKKYRFDFSMKKVSDKVYFQLLEIPTVPGLATDGFKDFVGSWWQIDTTQLGGMTDGLGTLDSFGVAEADLDENSKKLRQLLLTSKFFDDIEYEGTDEVGGSPAYVYSVALDRDGLVEYLKEFAAINGQAPTEQEEADLAAGLSVLKFEGDVYVDVASSVLVKVDGEFVFTSPDTKDKGVIDLDFSVSDLNKPFEIKEPIDFKVFDLGAFFGAFLGAGMSGGFDAAVE